MTTMAGVLACQHTFSFATTDMQQLPWNRMQLLLKLWQHVLTPLIDNNTPPKPTSLAQYHPWAPYQVSCHPHTPQMTNSTRNLTSPCIYLGCWPPFGQQKMRYGPFQNILPDMPSYMSLERAIWLLLGGVTDSCKLCTTKMWNCRGQEPNKWVYGGRISWYKTRSTCSMSPLVSKLDIRLLFGGGTGLCKMCATKKCNCTWTG